MEDQHSRQYHAERARYAARQTEKAWELMSLYPSEETEASYRWWKSEFNHHWQEAFKGQRPQ